MYSLVRIGWPHLCPQRSLMRLSSQPHPIHFVSILFNNRLYNFSFDISSLKKLYNSWSPLLSVLLSDELPVFLQLSFPWWKGHSSPATTFPQHSLVKERMTEKIAPVLLRSCNNEGLRFHKRVLFTVLTIWMHRNGIQELLEQFAVHCILLIASVLTKLTYYVSLRNIRVIYFRMLQCILCHKAYGYFWWEMKMNSRKNI